MIRNDGYERVFTAFLRLYISVNCKKCKYNHVNRCKIMRKVSLTCFGERSRVGNGENADEDQSFHHLVILAWKSSGNIL